MRKGSVCSYLLLMDSYLLQCLTCATQNVHVDNYIIQNCVCFIGEVGTHALRSTVSSGHPIEMAELCGWSMFTARKKRVTEL